MSQYSIKAARHEINQHTHTHIHTHTHTWRHHSASDFAIVAMEKDEIRKLRSNFLANVKSSSSLTANDWCPPKQGVHVDTWTKI